MPSTQPRRLPGAESFSLQPCAQEPRAPEVAVGTSRLSEVAETSGRGSKSLPKQQQAARRSGRARKPVRGKGHLATPRPSGPPSLPRDPLSPASPPPEESARGPEAPDPLSDATATPSGNPSAKSGSEAVAGLCSSHLNDGLPTDPLPSLPAAGGGSAPRAGKRRRTGGERVAESASEPRDDAPASPGDGANLDLEAFAATAAAAAAASVAIGAADAAWGAINPILLLDAVGASATDVYREADIFMARCFAGRGLRGPAHGREQGVCVGGAEAEAAERTGPGPDAFSPQRAAERLVVDTTVPDQ